MIVKKKKKKFQSLTIVRKNKFEMRGCRQVHATLAPHLSCIYERRLSPNRFTPKYFQVRLDVHTTSTVCHILVRKSEEKEKQVQRKFSFKMNHVTIQDSNKLDNTNYESWKTEMRSLLRINELWDYVSGMVIRNEENHVAWREKDEKALDLIILNIKKNQYIHIKNAETSHQAWNSLENLYESQAPMRQYTLLAELFRKRKGTETMAEYIQDYANKVERMEKAGVVLPQNVYILMLLLSLPADYESFCVAIQSRDRLPTYEELIVKLLDEEARRLNNQQKPADVAQAEQNLAMISNAENQKKRPTDQQKYGTEKCHACGRALKKKDSKREKIPRTE